MNPLFPKTRKVTVPLAVKYPYTIDDDEYHPIDEKFHYENLLGKLFGEEGHEMQIVDIKIKGNFLVLEVI